MKKQLNIKDFKGGFGQDLVKSTDRFLDGNNFYYDFKDNTFKMFSYLARTTYQLSRYFDFLLEDYSKEYASVFLDKIVVPAFNGSTLYLYKWDATVGWQVARTFSAGDEEICLTFVFKNKLFFQFWDNSENEVALTYTTDLSSYIDISSTPSYINDYAILDGVLYVADDDTVYKSTDGIIYDAIYDLPATHGNPNLEVFSNQLFLSYANVSNAGEALLFRYDKADETFIQLDFKGAFTKLVATSEYLLLFSKNEVNLLIYTYDLNEFKLVNSISLDFFKGSDYDSNLFFRYLKASEDTIFVTIDYDTGAKRSTRYIYYFNPFTFAFFPLRDLDKADYNFIQQALEFKGESYFLGSSHVLATSKEISLNTISSNFLVYPAYLESSVYRIPQGSPRSLILRHSPIPDCVNEETVAINVYVAYDENCFGTRVYESTPIISNSVTGSIFKKYDFDNGLVKEAIAFKVEVIVEGEDPDPDISDNLLDVELSFIYEETGVETPTNY